MLCRYQSIIAVGVFGDHVLGINEIERDTHQGIALVEVGCFARPLLQLGCRERSAPIAFGIVAKGVPVSVG